MTFSERDNDALSYFLSGHQLRGRKASVLGELDTLIAGLVALRGQALVFSQVGVCLIRRYALPMMVAFAAILGPAAGPAWAQTSPSGSPSGHEELLRRIAALEAELRQLKTEVMKDAAPGAALPAMSAVASDTDSLQNVTIAAGLDTYFSVNLAQPIGRVNLLRAYDVTSNSFSLNQASLIVESAPDDFSDAPFFITRSVAERDRHQHTFGLGAVWWWGNKRGSW